MNVKINYLLMALLVAPGFMMYSSGEDITPSAHSGNLSHPDKDVYVIHATVYEVGILTNKTDNKTSGPTTGSQESVTFFRTNGSNVDLGGIPKPLLTNVTAQSMVAVASLANGTRDPGAWTRVASQFASLPPDTPSMKKSGTIREDRSSTLDSSRFLRKLFRRSLNGTTPVKVVTGTALIPPGVGLQTISLPPLLSLNNNLSGIPVPIPNTVVVNYAKVNTLVRSP